MRREAILGGVGVVIAIAGLFIAAIGLGVLFDFRSSGSRFIAYAGRTARFSWQQTVNPNNTFVTHPIFNRIGFGIVITVIGSVWLGWAVYGLFR